MMDSGWSELEHALEKLVAEGKLGELPDEMTPRSAALLRELIESKRVRGDAVHAHGGGVTPDTLYKIIDHLPYMLFLKDAQDLRLRIWNKAGERLLGLSKTEMLGRSDHDLFPPDQADFFVEKDRQVLSGSELADIEEPIETANDGLRWLITRKTPLYDAAGDPEFLLGISYDVTERRTALIAMSEAKDAAERANAARQHFVANVSHELLTPLTLIVGPAAALLEQPGLDDEQRALLKQILRNGHRLQGEVDELLEFARGDAAGEPRWRNVLVEPLLRELLAEGATIATGRGLSLRSEMTLPTGFRVRGDRRMLEKIVLNLLGNALKFTTSGVVELAAAIVGDDLQISVRDTGHGISPGAIERIFERFERGDRAGSGTGVGLGLAIVQELVRLHDGEVIVESRVGHGSLFTVKIPAVVDDDLEDDLSSQPIYRKRLADHALPMPRTSPNERADQADETRPRILLVEDNAELAAFVRAVLSDEFNVEISGTGREALEICQESPPDAVVCDMMLPEVDGFEVIKRLRNEPETQSLPILMLTARSSSDVVAKALELGADDYIRKPFGPVELKARIRSALRLRTTQRSLEAANARLVRSLASATQREALYFARRLTRGLHTRLIEILGDEAATHELLLQRLIGRMETIAQIAAFDIVESHVAGETDLAELLPDLIRQELDRYQIQLSIAGAPMAPLAPTVISTALRQLLRVFELDNGARPRIELAVSARSSGTRIVLSSPDVTPELVTKRLDICRADTDADELIRDLALLTAQQILALAGGQVRVEGHALVVEV